MGLSWYTCACHPALLSGPSNIVFLNFCTSQDPISLFFSHLYQTFLSLFSFFLSFDPNNNAMKVVVHNLKTIQCFQKKSAFPFFNIFFKILYITLI